MLDRIANWLGYEKRSESAADHDRFGPGWNRARLGTYGVSASAVLSGLSVAARAVSVRAELLSTVALKVYRELPDGTRERVTDSTLSDVLERDANPNQTAQEVREFLIRGMDLYGNSYCTIERDGRGEVVNIWPVASTNVIIERLPSGKPRYRVSNDGGSRVYLADEMLHVRGPTADGSLYGQSLIDISSKTLGLGLALNETQAGLASNSLRPSLVVSHPGKLTAQAVANLRAFLSDWNAGPGHAGRPLILEEGIKPETISHSAAESQLLEARKLSAEDAARVFNVPGGVVGIRDSVSYGSAQADALALIQNCLAPLAERVEQCMMRCLLTPTERRTLVIEHDLSSLLRGSDAEQWNIHRTQREIGFTSTNELRRLHNKPPIEGGDDFTPLRAATPQQAEPPIASTK